MLIAGPTDLSSATRTVDWGTVAPWGIYPVSALAWGAFGWGGGVGVRWRGWRRGTALPEDRWHPIGRRLWHMVSGAFGLARLQRQPRAAWMHLAVIWGLVVLFAASLVDFAQHDLHWRIAQGAFYLYFQSLAVNLMGAMAALGALAWLGRRLVTRPARLRTPARWDATASVVVNVVWLLLILATGYCIFRLDSPAIADSPHQRTGKWSPLVCEVLTTRWLPFPPNRPR